VLASGTPPLSYQWYLNGNALESRTNAAFTLINLQSNQAGAYFVAITNLSGSIISSTAQLAVITLSPPVCIPIATGAVAWWRAESNTFDTVGTSDLFAVGPNSNPFDLRPFETSFAAGKVGTAFWFAIDDWSFYLPSF